MYHFDPLTLSGCAIRHERIPHIFKEILNIYFGIECVEYKPSRGLNQWSTYYTNFTLGFHERETVENIFLLLRSDTLFDFITPYNSWGYYSLLRISLPNELYRRCIVVPLSYGHRTVITPRVRHNSQGLTWWESSISCYSLQDSVASKSHTNSHFLNLRCTWNIFNQLYVWRILILPPHCVTDTWMEFVLWHSGGKRSLGLPLNLRVRQTEKILLCHENITISL